MMTFADGDEILMVGAGPSGLALALGLAARGRAVRVVDRAEAGTNLSRAAVVHPATLEALQSVGATEPLLARALRVPDFRIRDGRRDLATVSFAGLPTAHPFTAMVPQSETEAVLRARLVELGVEVEWRTELVAIEQDDARVRATLRRADGDEAVESAYLIGADGGRSTTRELIGIDFSGAGYEADFLLADVRMDWAVERGAVSLTFAPAGLLVVAPLPGDHFRVVATVADAPEHPGVTDVQAIVDERGSGTVH